MLVIRLQRIGKKHQPSYRVVVAERRSKMGAPPVEDLGAYSPSTKAIHLNKDRIAHWIKVGAQPTATIHNMLVREGVVAGPKTPIHIKKKAVEAGVPAGNPAVAGPAPEAAPQESAPENAAA